MAPDRFEKLAKLLGRTRARVLVAIGRRPGVSTSALAAHCVISLASASEHATVLREAGLATVGRAGNEVRHRLTDLGERLLDQR